MLGIIINPKSGGTTYVKQMKYLFDVLERHCRKYTYRITCYAKHATELARELVESGCREILVLGGDGTFSEVIDGVMHAQIAEQERRNISFGLIPRGTGNDWARYWKLNSNYKRSLDIYVNSGKKKPIDIGCITLNRNSEQEKHYFVNSIGFGVDAKTVQRADVLKYYVGSHGLNYFFGLLSVVLNHKALPIEITTDTGLKISEQMFTMNIANGPYCGGGIRLNPDANPCDGMFHCMFLGRLTFQVLKSALPNLFNGGLKNVDLIRNFTARKIVLNTNDYLMFEKDGILIDACGPYTVEIIPSALQMIIPE